MTAMLRAKIGSAGLLWLLAAGTLCGGYVVITLQYRSAMTATQHRVEYLYRRIGADERHIRALSAALAARRPAEREIDPALLGTSESVQMARLLRLVARTAAALHVRIVSVEPGAAAAAAPRDRVALLPVTIRIEGHFHDVLAFLVALPQREAPLSIDRTDVNAATGATAGKPLVDGTIETTLYRIRRHRMEVQHASGAR